MRPSLKEVANRLMDLSEKFGQLVPEFYVAELEYVNKRADTMLSQQVMGLGSQPLREAECEKIMNQTKEYETYHKLKPEIDVVNKQLWIYMELSKLIRASQFEQV